MIEQLEPNILQEMFNSIIEDADANILIVNDQFEVVSINNGFYWIFLENYGLDLKPGSSIIDAMAGVNASLAAVWQSRCVLAMDSSPFRVEDTFELDGRTFHWEVYYKAIPMHGQVYISVFSRDITVRKAYQRRLLENEANLRSIINTVDNSIWLINTQFELIDFNKEFYKQYKKAFGVRLERGKSIIELLPLESHELRKIWTDRYMQGLRGRPGRYVDTYLIDEEWRVFEIKTYPIVEDSVVTGLTVYSRDITAFKQVEDKLKAQNQELSRINAELDRFVYSASHDLRAPLMSIKGLINLIRLENQSEPILNYLNLVDRSIFKLDNFITDIIHYSRNSRMELMPVLIDFESLLEESLSSLRYMDEANKVRAIKSITIDTPFYSDKSRLLIVMNNMLSNAVRYRDPWKADSFVQIKIDVTESEALLEFTDNGIGIADHYLTKIFNMFFRASADSKGSGLGLYIVKSAVEKLDGVIAVESELGVGTTFRITIPNQKPLTQQLIQTSG
ncbi:MAG: PAS domain-containing sensor histidine kinase [Cyclobacteriaceae bacterium]|nr:PAS domain-containing sensor histidine kinase [Cyclobacteriaceae bacterium]